MAENNSSATLKTAGVSLAEHRANRIYVAGPMTGLPDFNFPAFNTAANELRAEGWHVENPAEHGILDGAQWSDYMHTDLQQLSTCCAIYLLHGWSKSRGATLEAHVAQALGMAVYYASNAETQAVEAQAPASVAVPPLTPDEARQAARNARLMNGPSDPTQPSEYAMAGALALAAKLAATPALPATEDSSAGELAEPSPQELMALSNECMKLPGGMGMHYLNYAKAVLARWGTAPQAQPADAPWLTQQDSEALQRFADTTDDDQSYDIGKEAIARLAGFGCLQSHGFGRYSITDFGHYVLNDWAQARVLPFATQAERDAGRRAAMAAAQEGGAA